MNSEPMILRIKMAKVADYWRIIVVQDLAGVIGQLKGSIAGTATAPDVAPTAPSSAPAHTPAPTENIPYPGGNKTSAPTPPPQKESPPPEDPIGDGGFIEPYVPNQPTTAEPTDSPYPTGDGK